MNNTVEFWEIDNVSLHQFGWSVTTIGGARYNLPSRRGENLTLSYTAGTRWRPKIADQRTISLAMFLVGMDPATGNSTGDQVLRWNDSWDFLRRLLWRVDGRQFILRRRQRLTINGHEQVLVTEGLAELSGTMEPTMNGRTRADFVIDLLMADPYFYAAEQSTTVPKSAPTAVLNPGFDTASSTHCTVRFNGPLSNPRLTNATFDPDVWVQYNAAIPANTRIDLNIADYTAVINHSQTNVVDRIAFSGSRRWMGFTPGSNLMTLTADTGSGNATVLFRPPYL